MNHTDLIYTIAKKTMLLTGKTWFKYSVDFENTETEPKQGSLEKDLSADTIRQIGREIARKLIVNGTSSYIIKDVPGELSASGDFVVCTNQLTPYDKTGLFFSVKNFYEEYKKELEG